MLLGRLAISGSKPDIRMSQASRETVLSILGGSSGVSIVCEGSTGALYPDVVYRPIHGEQGPALTGYSGCWRDEAEPAAASWVYKLSEGLTLCDGQGRCGKRALGRSSMGREAVVDVATAALPHPQKWWSPQVSIRSRLRLSLRGWLIGDFRSGRIVAASSP
jgi:hypothetical protein